jgi:hypothetical protein
MILRILAAPLAGILTLAVAFCSFVLAISGVALGIVSVLVFIIGVSTFFFNTPAMAIAWIAIAFLISPFGLPSLAGWIVDKVDDLNGVLKAFIFG